MSIDKLNKSNLFHFYVLNPRHENLSTTDKKIATLFTILLSIPIGLGILFCRLFLYNKNYPTTIAKTAAVAENSIGKKGKSISKTVSTNSDVNSKNPINYTTVPSTNLPKEKIVEKEKDKLPDAVDRESLDDDETNTDDMSSKKDDKTNDDTRGQSDQQSSLSDLQTLEHSKQSAISDYKKTNPMISTIGNDKSHVTAKDNIVLDDPKVPKVLNTVRDLLGLDFTQPSDKNLSNVWTIELDPSHSLMKEHLLARKKLRTVTSNDDHIDHFRSETFANFLNWDRTQLKNYCDKDETPEQFIDNLKARLMLLNDECQLLDRMDSGKCRQIIMEDFEEPWDKSGLRIIFMTDQEVSQLPIQELEQMTSRQIQLLNWKNKIKCDFQNTSYVNLSFGQLNSLNGMDLVKELPDMHPNVIACITKSQINEMSFDNLDRNVPTHQNAFKILFKSQNKIELLNIKQINSCMQFIEYIYGHLKEKIIQQLDFSSINEDQFDDLFPVLSNRVIIELNNYNQNPLHKLTIPQVYSVLHFFDASRFYQLSEQQFKTFDLSFFDNSNNYHVECFHGLFKIGNEKINTDKLRLLSKEQIRDVWDMLNKEEIEKLSLSQIDFKMHPFTQEQFEWLFPLKTKTNEISDMTYLSGDQLNSIVELNLLDSERLSYLKKEQIRDLNILDPKIFDFINKNVLQKGLFEKLSSEQTRYLLKNLDIKSLTPTHIDLFFPIFEGESHIHLIKDISMLSEEQLEQFLPLFDANRLFRLSDEQIKKLDFSNFNNDDHNDSLRFHGIFKLSKLNAAKLKLLSKQQIEQAWKLFNKEELNYLSQSQVEQINFLRCQPTNVQFEALFPIVSDGYKDYSMIRKLKSDQIRDLISLKLFDVERAAYLSLDQINSLDFSDGILLEFFKKNHPKFPDSLRMLLTKKIGARLDQD